MDELRLNDNGEPSDAAETASWDEPLLAEDLEQAYLRALEATDAVEREMNSLPQPDANTDHAPANVAADVASSSDSARQPTTGSQPASLTGELQTTAAQPHRVSEKQVVEAALFVGGMSLTAKKLSSLFHTDHGFGFVECLIDELNRQYADEGRPYSITLGEGGYRMTLLPDFESVRNQVFGYGPKDVKLTQDALEVLSLVAYRQPITKSHIEALGKSNSGPLLRQLLQRELIRIDREHSASESQRKSDPPYATTPRFLSLFGLGSLRDLPVAEDFQFK
ncbi:MAG TPA: SMC-Scp complex subunit ScpB [Planctomycetaceae bacterium]|nr:SMC-Scp complex subunit ScpB [Planctomycetaceae bacterium]